MSGHGGVVKALKAQHGSLDLNEGSVLNVTNSPHIYHECIVSFTLVCRPDRIRTSFHECIKHDAAILGNG